MPTKSQPAPEPVQQRAVAEAKDPAPQPSPQLPENVDEILASADDMLRTPSGFVLVQRIATALSRSTLIPEAYRNNVPNCMIAVEMAARLRASPLQVMQSLDVINGRPSWRSSFIIAAINTSGRFSPLRFVMKGEGMNRSCTATAMELKTGDQYEGPEVTMAIAKAEGWLDRTGSKWRTMPELMLRYRSAAFFGRLYVPEVLLGMLTSEEQGDIIDVTPDKKTDAPVGVTGAKQMLGQPSQQTSG